MRNPFKRRKEEPAESGETPAAAPSGGYGFANLASQSPQPGQGLDALDGIGMLAAYWGQFGQMMQSGQLDQAQIERMMQSGQLDQAQIERMKQAFGQSMPGVDASAMFAGGIAPTIDMRGDAELRAKIEKLVGHSLTPGTTESVDTTADPELGAKIMQVVQEHYAEKAREQPSE